MAPGWDNRHAYFEEIARPVTDLMLQRLAAERGQTILDLAAGTGVAGFAAAGVVGREGHVIVSDFAERMVDAAKRHAARFGLTNVECRVLDAEQLDLADDAVDGVICRWGYMLMADPAAAFRETRRVLRPGGRLAFAVFTGPDENPWGALPAAVLVERRHMPPPAAGAPGLFALADRSRLSQLLTQTGFSEPRFEEVAFTWRFADQDAFWTFLSEAAGAITIVLDRLDDHERLSVGQEIRERVEAFDGPNGIELQGVSLVASAT
jgi:SAM-dependent methyltransferase